ncbi:hypothetical protein Krac_5546 [Ktedonobacter racemifer DSM 44963]|uniref:Uncharacterized protein n=1 Tax=Ktedonobacter racemifer DSM 44963 TaxID=485913 RepID=D6TWA4_KTERA|nr:hypothetical protein Krac_5546 [Ktedonobacter racemifer DSM 44963]
MSIILMRKKNVVKRRAGCFQKVDNVRTPSLWILLKEATEGLLSGGSTGLTNAQLKISSRNLYDSPTSSEGKPPFRRGRRVIHATLGSFKGLMPSARLNGERFRFCIPL